MDRLSSTFSALADPTRRAILVRLALGETSVNELAKPFDMSLPAVVEASESSGRSWADYARARRAVAAVQAGSRPSERGGRLDRVLPPLLGSEPRSPRRLSQAPAVQRARAQKAGREKTGIKGETPWPQMRCRQGRSSSPAPSMRRARRCGKAWTEREALGAMVGAERLRCRSGCTGRASGRNFSLRHRHVGRQKDMGPLRLSRRSKSPRVLCSLIHFRTRKAGSRARSLARASDGNSQRPDPHRKRRQDHAQARGQPDQSDRQGNGRCSKACTSRWIRALAEPSISSTSISPRTETGRAEK